MWFLCGLCMLVVSIDLRTLVLLFQQSLWFGLDGHVGLVGIRLVSYSKFRRQCVHIL